MPRYGFSAFIPLKPTGYAAERFRATANVELRPMAWFLKHKEIDSPDLGSVRGKTLEVGDSRRGLGLEDVQKAWSEVEKRAHHKPFQHLFSRENEGEDCIFHGGKSKRERRPAQPFCVRNDVGRCGRHFDAFDGCHFDDLDIQAERFPVFGIDENPYSIVGDGNQFDTASFLIPGWGGKVGPAGPALTEVAHRKKFPVFRSGENLTSCVGCQEREGSGSSQTGGLEGRRHPLTTSSAIPLLRRQPIVASQGKMMNKSHLPLFLSLFEF
jgi:hypothetical protein